MNERLIGLYIGRLRRLAESTYQGKPFLLPEGTVSRLDQVERRLIEALRRDDTGSTSRDGFPTGNVGPGGQDAPQSSTEGSALSGYRVDGDVEHGEGEWSQPPHDPHHERTQAAFRALERAYEALGELFEKLESIDKLAKVPRHDPSGHCLCCDRWVEGTANDRLKSGYCHADYQAWLREGRPDRVDFERRRRAERAA